MRIEEGQWARWVADHEDNHTTWCSKGPFSSGAKKERPKHVKEQRKSRQCQSPSLIASSISSLASRSLYPQPHSCKSHSSGFAHSHFFFFFNLGLHLSDRVFMFLFHVLAVSMPRFELLSQAGDCCVMLLWVTGSFPEEKGTAVFVVRLLLTL